MTTTISSEILLQIRSRKKYYVLVKKHVIERALHHQLCHLDSIRAFEQSLIKALKSNGILVKADRGDCDCYCLFKTEEGLCIRAPVRIQEKRRRFVVNSAWEAEPAYQKLYSQATRVNYGAEVE